MARSGIVSVVDDDESVRASLPDLLRELGFAVQAFASAEEFLSSGCVDITSCLILDVGMPGMSGPDLQRELQRQRRAIPIVFITAHDSVRLWAPASEEGTVQCLLKPFSDTAIVRALQAALHL